MWNIDYLNNAKNRYNDPFFPNPRIVWDPNLLVRHFLERVFPAGHGWVPRHSARRARVCQMNSLKSCPNCLRKGLPNGFSSDVRVFVVAVHFE